MSSNEHDETSVCRTCKEELPIDRFTRYKGPNGKYYYRKDCKDCSYVKYSLSGFDSLLDRKAYMAWYTLKKKGVETTKEEVLALLEAADGKCEVCGGEYRVAVDHCDVTKDLRGILCFHCNVGLGQFKHDPERLERAKEYLKKSLAKGLERCSRTAIE